MLNLSLVIVPAWLEDALRKAGMGVERALDLSALSRISSLEDVAFYTSVNYHLFNQIPKPIKETFDSYRFFSDENKLGRTHVKADDLGNYPTDTEYKALIDKVRDKTWGDGAVRFGNPTPRQLLAVLPYTKESQDIPNTSLNFLFDVFYLTDDIVGIRFYLANPKRPFNEQLYQCYDRLLAFLTSHRKFEQVATTPVFQEFVNMSRTQPHPYGLS